MPTQAKNGGTLTEGESLENITLSVKEHKIGVCRKVTETEEDGDQR